jgi:hypothetical protein
MPCGEAMGLDLVMFQSERHGKAIVHRVGLREQLNTVSLPSLTWGDILNSFDNQKWVHEKKCGCIWKTVQYVHSFGLGPDV